MLSIIGWYGVGAIFGAYLLVTMNWLAPSSLVYLLLNLSGSLALGVEAWNKRDYQPTVLNVLWAVVAIISLLRILWVE